MRDGGTLTDQVPCLRVWETGSFLILAPSRIFENQSRVLEGWDVVSEYLKVQLSLFYES